MRPMILLIGASASGKTEVAKLLRKKYGIVKAITMTSRIPRPGEKDGVDYFFVSPEQFQTNWQAGLLVENTFYNGHYYGCPKSQVRADRCVVVDPNGLRSFLALHNPSIVTFFLEAKETTRRARMHARGDKEEDIEKRILNDRKDFRPELIAPTDFHIRTDEMTLEAIADEVYGKYLETLRERQLADEPSSKK
jgi:guanylate kinase